MGIWDNSGDGSDVNTAIISGKPETWISPTESKSEVVITGDDLGQVNVFAYPVIAKKNAGVRTYLGHSSHVPCVRLSPGDKYLFSAGGHDLTVFQWKLRKAGQAETKEDQAQNGTRSGDAPTSESGAAGEAQPEAQPEAQSEAQPEAQPEAGEAQPEAGEAQPEAQAEAAEEAQAENGEEQQEQHADDGGDQPADVETEEQPQDE